jgi:large subunit ribosomal protein L24
LKIKKGDKVKILSGKARGKVSHVLRIFPKKDRVLVSKINIVKKHKKKTGNEKDPGGIIESERPIHVSNVILLCSACGKPTRVGYEMKEGRKYRKCKKCGALLDQKKET